MKKKKDPENSFNVKGEMKQEKDDETDMVIALYILFTVYFCLLFTLKKE